MTTKAERNRQNAPSRNRYNAKSYDTVLLRIRKDGTDQVTREQIYAAAASSGMSVNAWVLDLIRRELMG